jgi:hypothetical protein
MKKLSNFLNKTLFTLGLKDLTIIFLVIVISYLCHSLKVTKRKLTVAEQGVRNSYCGEIMNPLVIDVWFGK